METGILCRAIGASLSALKSHSTNRSKGVHRTCRKAPRPYARVLLTSQNVNSEDRRSDRPFRYLLPL